MLPYRDSRLTYIALGAFFLIILGYAYYEAQGILFGPSISVISTRTEVRDPFILIKGQADRIASISMNGKDIAVTETGAFEEPYLLAPGYNRVVLEAKDRYGRKSSKTIEIIYTPSPDSVSTHSTSSLQTSSVQDTTSTSTAPSPAPVAL